MTRLIGKTKNLMNKKIVNAERTIDKICSNHGVSREGAFWLTQALDPFKDLVRPHPGYPDKVMDPSIVEVVKQSVTITSGGLVGDWDCNIFLDQQLISVPLFSTTASGNSRFRSGQGATPFNRGGLVVRRDVNGGSLDITKTVNALCLGVESTLYDNESCRIVGVGFEVHDVTAELDKQGSCTAWRVPKPDGTPRFLNVTEDNGVTPCVPNCVAAVTCAIPPYSINEAVDLPGSVQWEAKEGLYTVPILVDEVNPPCSREQLALSCIENSIQYFPQISTTGAAKLITCLSPNCNSAFSMQGALFSGLKNSAELLVNFTYFLERFPNKISAIKRLCYPSPNFDPAVFKLYSSVANKIPVGVMVKENGLGDWISGVARIISTVAGFVPHPIGKVISTGASFVANAAESRTGKNLIKDVESVITVKQEPRVVEVFEPKNTRTLMIEPSRQPTQVTFLPPTRSANRVVRTSQVNRPNPLSQYTVHNNKNNANVWVNNKKGKTSNKKNRRG